MPPDIPTLRRWLTDVLGEEPPDWEINSTSKHILEELYLTHQRQEAAAALEMEELQEARCEFQAEINRLSQIFNKLARSPVNSRKKSDLDGVRNATKLIKGCDSKLVEAIVNEVVPKGATGVRFSDISGQEKAKAALQEMVVLPRFDNDFTSHHLP